MPRYRILAIDLDGTLLTNDKKITDDTKKWMAYAMEEGVIVVLATGRGLPVVEDIRKELYLNMPMVLLNGAEVWKNPTDLLERHFILDEDIKNIYKLAVEAKAFYWGYSAQSLVNAENWTDAMFNQQWLKFGIHHQDEAVLNELKRKICHFPNVEVTSSNQANLEVSFKGTSKESGVRKICEVLQMEMKDVMAIGDSLNDFRLIKAAGLGIAMGNADDSIKEIADETTDTNEKDGVAKAIQNFLL